MKVVTAREMKEIDRKTVEGYGIPGAVLMERAGLAVARRIKEEFKPQKTIVLVGPGSNGGDGLVVARELKNAGWNVKALLFQPEDRLNPGCRAELLIARKFGLPVEFRTKIDEKDTHGALLVDAIFGTGLGKPVKGHIADVIDTANASGSPIISVDIPSGVSSDTGDVMGAAIKATFTVTFGLPKRGHLLYPGAGCTGKLYVEDIGFPSVLLRAETLKCQTIERQDISVPERPVYSHKGDYGHVLLIAGSEGKTGAALMTARACLRSGAGLVTIGAPPALMGVMQSQVVEEMTMPLPKSVPALLRFIRERIDVLAIGPGIGTGRDAQRLVNGLLPQCPVPVVIDADGINVLGKETLRRMKAPVVITPHPGELGRLIGKSPSEIEKDRIGTAGGFAAAYLKAKSVIVLKGVPTVIADPSGRTFLNTTGNPGMAKAGSGDVLTGMIAAFLGQGLTPLNAAMTGVFMHGLSGDIAACRKGLHTLVATDIIDAIPEAFCSVKE